MRRYIAHLLLPRQRNNYRSKLLHNSSVFVLTLAILLISSAFVYTQRVHPQILGISYSISEQELLSYVNKERMDRGLSPLKLNSKLSVAALGKADDMFSHNYWAHYGPDGTTPWSFISKAGYDYLYAGENLAKGYTTSHDAVSAWMDSQTHRDNLLSKQYSEVGFAIKEGYLEGEDTVLIVQMLGSETNPVFAQSNEQSREFTRVNEEPQSPVQGASGGQNPDVAGTIEESTSFTVKPYIDAVFGSKVIMFVLLSLMLLALILDFVSVEKANLPRLVGNNFDHIILITLFLIFIFLSNFGRVL